MKKDIEALQAEIAELRKQVAALAIAFATTRSTTIVYQPYQPYVPSTPSNPWPYTITYGNTSGGSLSS